MNEARVPDDVLRLRHNGGTNCCVQLLVRELTVWAISSSMLSFACVFLQEAAIVVL